MMQCERGPLAVTRETRAEALGEEPLEAAKRAGERLASHHRQGLVGEGRGLGVGELTGPRDQGREHLNVAGDAVGHVETRRRDGVKTRTLFIESGASSNHARGVGEGS